MNADKKVLKKDYNNKIINLKDYNSKAAKIQADFDFKKKQAAAQSKRDMLISLGAMFFNQGLGYIASAPAVFFDPMRGGPMGAAAYASSGVALMGLGATLGYAGASVPIPQQASSGSTQRAASAETKKTFNIYIDNEAYRDRRHLDRVQQDRRYQMGG